MSKYNNYCKFLQEFFDIPTNLEDFTKDKKITFVFKSKGHTNTLGVASFGNKKSKIEAKEFFQLCKDEIEYIFLIFFLYFSYIFCDKYKKYFSFFEV
jgi:putative lipase involved disintegration of autophagic bodies